MIGFSRIGRFFGVKPKPAPLNGGDFELRERIFPAEHAALVKRIVDKQFAACLLQAREAVEKGQEEEVRQALLDAGYVPDIAMRQGEERVDARRVLVA